MRKLLIIIFISFLLLAGCSSSKSEYISPDKYYAEVSVSTNSSSDGQDVKYNLKILHKDNEYKIIINNNNINFLIQFNDGKYTVINEKFPDSKINTTFYNIENLYNEINLDKFNGLKSVSPNIVEAYDSEYKYVLQYEKRNFVPQKLTVYKNNLIVKIFEYKNIELYRH